jgi:PAS domain S-box-containing protein
MGFIPIPTLIILIGTVYLTVDRSLFYEPVWLLPLANTLFVTVICFVVAIIALGNYRATGRIQILFMGCGVLAFGTAAVLAAFLRDVPNLGANLNVTIYNSGALLGALCHSAAAIILLAGVPAEAGFKRRNRWILLGYGGALLLVGLVTIASVTGVLPAFFVQGTGPTPVRQVILGSADVLFAFCFVVFMVTFARNGEAFLFWYASALALTSISLTAFFIQTSVGSAIGWTGRCSQYVGGIYFLVAILTVIRSARVRRTSFHSVLAASLSPTAERLAEFFPECMIVHRGGRILYINPAGVSTLRAGSPEAVFGRSIFDIIVPENLELARQRVRKVEEEGETTPPIESEYLRFDGTRFMGEARGAPITYEGARSTLVVIRDISGRARMEQSLRASEDRFRSLFTGMTEGFALHEIVCSAEGVPVGYRFLEINPAFERLTGLKREQVIGRLHNEVLPDDDPNWVRIYGKVALTGEPVHFENFSPALNRHYDVFSYRPAPRQFAVIFMDITERKRMEDALLAARQDLENRVEERTAALTRTNKLLRLLSECNQALVTLDNEQELIRAICQIMHEQGGYLMAWVGYAEQDADRTVRPVAHAGFENGYLDTIRISWADTDLGRGPTGTAIREGRVCQASDFGAQAETTPWRTEALRRGFRSSIALPLFADGRPFGALSVYSDAPAGFDADQVGLLQELAGDMAYGIMALRGRKQRDTMRKNLEEKTVQLRSLASQIIQAEEGERRRIAKVLHDQLQQLIAGARYGLEGLKGMRGGAEFQEALSRVDAMMGESLNVSRSLTTELNPPVRHAGKLVPVLEWLAILMRQKYGLDVEVRNDGETSLKSEGVIVLLYQALRELLFNVVKHARVKSAVVSMQERDGGVTLAVEDRGTGFDPRLLEQSPRVSGGYGIFSIRERISLHGGRLEIESAPGKGSRFTLWVPVTEEAGQGETDAEPVAAKAKVIREARRETPARAGDGKRIRVLLADDHPVVRRGLALALKEQPDMEVVAEAQDGLQAVEMVSRFQPDVVIMDVKMPGMTGIEATRTIHAEYPHVRVIGFSAFEEAAQAKAMREAGAVGYLAKSDPPARLLATIRACAEG